MTVTLPDDVPISEGEVRLELACALYAQHKLSAVAGATLAGIDFFSFQHALKDRGIPRYTDDMLEQDLAAINAPFRK